MGRARGYSNAVAAYSVGAQRRGGANGRGAFGNGGTRSQQNAQSPARNRGTRPSAHKFHIEDLQYQPKLLRTAESIRAAALKRGGLVYSGHAVQARINDHLRPLSHEDIKRAVRAGAIIEINDGPEHDDMRLLVRDDRGTCVVYSVGLHKIVTCWWNDPDDHHSTLNLSEYMPLEGDEGPRQCQRILMRGVRFLTN